MKSKPTIDLRINIAGRTLRICLGVNVTKDEQQKLSREDTYAELSRMEDSINEIQNNLDMSDNNLPPNLSSNLDISDNNLPPAGNSRVLNKADIIEAEGSEGISIDDVFDIHDVKIDEDDDDPYETDYN